MRTRARWIYPLLPLMGLALACAEQADPEPVEMARPVIVEPVRIATLEERIEASGQLLAKDQATIAAELLGRITDLPVEEGMRVEKGQLLVAIDPEKRELELRDARARLAEARASLAERARDLERVRSLHAQAIASEQALDKARTELDLARSRVEAAEAQVGVAERALEDAQVRAPFAGQVAERSVSRGEFVQVGQPLLRIVALDPIEVEFSVAERDVARVRLGLRVAVQVAPYPGETFTGEVTIISPTIDQRTRTLRVKALIPNPDGRLRPGLFAKADLGVARREGALVVPEEAVLVRAEGEIVYVATRDDRARRVAVETGVRRDRQVEITRGLEAGQEVIVRGHSSLADGALISRRRADGSPASSRLGAAGRPAGLGLHADRMRGGS